MVSRQELDQVREGYRWFYGQGSGSGLRETLSRAIPGLKSSREALDVAFFQIVSGRAPEHRGNGLKFVRRTVNASDSRGLFFQSENDEIVLGGLGREVSDIVRAVGNPTPRKAPVGTLALLLWKK